MWWCYRHLKGLLHGLHTFLVLGCTWFNTPLTCLCSCSILIYPFASVLTHLAFHRQFKCCHITLKRISRQQTLRTQTAGLWEVCCQCNSGISFFLKKCFRKTTLTFSLLKAKSAILMWTYWSAYTSKETHVLKQALAHNWQTDILIHKIINNQLNLRFEFDLIWDFWCDIFKQM